MAIVGKHVVAVWMVLCFLAGVAYCAYRRTQLREKFGIAGAPHLLHGALPVRLSLSCCRHALCLLVRGCSTPCCLQQSLLVCLFLACCRHALCLLVRAPITPCFLRRMCAESGTGAVTAAEMSLLSSQAAALETSAHGYGVAPAPSAR